MSPFTRAYYALKPFLPIRLRNGMRRLHARRLRAGASRHWPILPGSERPPDGWSGWPDGKKFAVVLTHDVEGPAGYARIPDLALLEQELGFRSSFNLIPEGSYRVDPELRRWLGEQGFEVGIHDLHHDGKLYRSREEFARRAGKINQYVREWGASGFRSAYMHHNLDWLGDLDVAYDASTFDTDPFEPQPDGVGTIFPFWVPKNPNPNLDPNLNPAPNPNARSAMQSALATGSSSPRSSAFRLPSRAPSEDGFVELPYTLAQDSTLFLILGEQGIDCWKKKIRWLAAHGGMALVNVHPDYIHFQGTPRPYSYSVTLYQELLAFLTREYADQFWLALPCEVASRFRSSIVRPVAVSPV